MAKPENLFSNRKTMASSVYRLDRRQRDTVERTTTTYYLLPTTNYQLPTTNYLLPTTATATATATTVNRVT